MELRSGNIIYNENNMDFNDPDEEYYNNLGRQFNIWKGHINRFCLREVNMGCDDLPDMPYYDCFVEGITARDMATKLLRDCYYCMME